MATILDKDLLRESTQKFEDREIMVTLTDKQTISLKLKGLKSGEVSIGILPLYKQLKGIEEPDVKLPKGKTEPIKEPKKIKGLDGDPIINLEKLTALALVTKMDFKAKMELEKVMPI